MKEQDARYNELLYILKNNNHPRSVQKELDEFTRDYCILNLTTLPLQHRNDTNAIMNILYNKLTYKPNAWKSLTISKKIFSDPTYATHPYYNECFAKAFEKEKWDFIADCCNLPTALNCAHLIPLVEHSSHDIKVMNNYFTVNKEQVLKCPALLAAMTKVNPMIASNFYKSHQENLEFIQDIAAVQPIIVKYLESGHPITKNEDIMTKAILLDETLYFKASKEIQSNEALISSIIKTNSQMAEFLCDNYDKLPPSIQSLENINKKSDKFSEPNEPSGPIPKKYTKQELEKLNELLKKDPSLIGKTFFANDPKIMIKLIAKDYTLYNQAADFLRRDIKFLCMAVKVNYKVAALLPLQNRQDPKLMLLLIKMDNRAIEFADDKLKKSKTFIKQYNQILQESQDKKTTIDNNQTSDNG